MQYYICINKTTIFILEWVNYICFLSLDVKYYNLLYQLLITPFVTYNNAFKDKNLAIKQNKIKSGIYRWVHKKSGKSYIDSSVDLSNRFSQYFNYNHITNPKQKWLYTEQS